MHSHCNACKALSGGAYTLNQIIPKDDLKITKGDVKTYTYKGDSGTFSVTISHRLVRDLHQQLDHRDIKSPRLDDPARAPHGEDLACSRLIVDAQANWSIATTAVSLHPLEHCFDRRLIRSANCTTHVYHRQEALPDMVIARTGLIDPSGQAGFKPAAEVYGKDRYKWEPEIAQTYEVMPPM